VLFHRFELRANFVVNKFAHRFADHSLFFGKIFGRKNLARRSVFNQKRAAFDVVFARTRLMGHMPSRSSLV
jgi:hypothetical protein